VPGRSRSTSPRGAATRGVGGSSPRCLRLVEGLRDGGIAGHPALEEDRGREALPLADDAAEVASEGLTEPGEDVGEGNALLLQVDHVGLGEDGAAAGHAGRVAGGEGQTGELPVDADAEALGLLVEERACARGAQRVHGEVAERHLAGGLVPLHREELGVLPADLDDRPRLGVEDAHRPRLGDELVVVNPADEARHRTTTRPGETDGEDPRPCELPVEKSTGLEEGLPGLPVGPHVAVGEDLTAGVQHDQLDRGRADVDAEGDVAHLIPTLLPG